jgi:hypothetical protein
MAYYCLHELSILPSEFLELPQKERAFIAAAIDIKVEKEKKEQRAMNRKSLRRKR